MYVLSEQLDTDTEGDPSIPFQRYTEYLRRNRPRFPTAAYRLASSGLLLNANDPRCPHDGWLEWAKFEEAAEGERDEIRSLSLRVRLLGAYHDRFIELFYPQVFSYAMTNPCSVAGHFDWRYSEIRLSDKGNVIHEIEWAGSLDKEARWVIEASDVQLETFPLDPQTFQRIDAGRAAKDGCQQTLEQVCGLLGELPEVEVLGSELGDGYACIEIMVGSVATTEALQRMALGANVGLEPWIRTSDAGNLDYPPVRHTLDAFTSQRDLFAFGEMQLLGIHLVWHLHKTGLLATPRANALLYKWHGAAVGD
ncbi:hypothetical protein [Montanilutibacter psychrotolerans]|uniref:Uncharacterized protein n=1 Tax=Montanilutibacter psychrotolerans TaxID=1327343 RepID=A0A3M8SXM9_9GAMM|nr:hypothetical protein [Lysobacter psychrotolerans]RNF83590.1 hypothetical protein EER27_09355 [Lysobacter psychrotolerans]